MLTKTLPLIFAAVVISSCLECSVFAEASASFDFESGALEGWKGFGDSAEAKTTASGDWRKINAAFNSGEYEMLRPYIRIQSGVGTVWFDKAEISGIELKNPSFEQVEGEGDKIAGWAQDNVGRTIFSENKITIDGKRGVRIHQIEDGMSRLWQDVKCRPKTEYTFSVWIRTSRLEGNAYGEIYGMNPDGSHGRNIVHALYTADHTHLSLGDYVAELYLKKRGSGGITRDVQAPADANLSLEADLSTQQLENGLLNVLVWDGDSLLGRIESAESAQAWTHRRVTFQSPPDGKLTLQMKIEGDRGRGCVDNIKIVTPLLTGPPKSARFGKASENLMLDGVLRAEIKGPYGELLRNGLDILNKELGARREGTGIRLSARRGSGGVGDARLLIEVQDPQVTDWPDSESYSLNVTKSEISVKGKSERGAFYGLMTLTNLLDETLKGSLVMLGGEIADAPDMPLRGTYIAGLPRDQKDRINWCERFAKLRLNTVLIEDDIFFHLDDENNRKISQEAFADFRAYDLEPIPELQSFGWAGILLRINPNIAEGTYVEGEELTLKGEEPTPLAHPNVIRTPSTDVVLKSSDGKTTYKLGEDYQVIVGVITYVYLTDHEPFKVKRTPNSRIPDGATVVASYDYVSRVNTRNCPYCPSEPLVYDILVPALQNTVRYLKPKYVHIGHDEPWQMNTDSRCRKNDKTNAQLFAEDVNLLNEKAHDIDPKVRLMMWADAVNPYHNGLHFKDDPTANAIDLLPKDVIQCVWFYGAGEPLGRGARSLDHFAQHGFTTTGSPWYNAVCCTGWAKAVHAARSKGQDCLGVIYTSWANRWEALEVMARSSWRVPVDNER